jgi:predicted PurR-regulated permease PerM
MFATDMAEMTQSRKQSGSGLRVLLSLASVVVIVMGLKASAALFIPVMMGLFLALLSLPILNWLDARALPRPLAVVATVLIDLLFLFVIVFLLSGVIGDLQSKSTEYAERMRKQAAHFSTSMDQQIARFGGFWARAGDEILPGTTPTAESGPAPEATLEVPPAITLGSDPDNGMATVIDASFPTFQDLFERYWDSNRLVAMIGQFDVVSRFTSLASQSIFALIVMIFILAESGRYAHKVRDVLRVKGPDLSLFQNTSRDIQKYLAIKTVASAVTGILAAISCIIFRVDFPLLWGLVAFLFNYVPAIGSIFAAVPPVLLALILHGFWPGVGVLACYLVINFTIGNFLEPIFLGDRFGISTVIVVLSVLFWGFIWGPVGMLLAVPLTMLVKVMLDNNSDLRWISAFMGKGHAEPVEDADEDEGGAEAVAVPEAGGKG